MEEGIFLILAGIAVVSMIMVDVVWTTVSTHGGGMITNPLVKGVDRVLGIGRRSSSSSLLLSLSGPLAVTAVMLVWTAGLWLGWLLLFSADPQGIVNPETDKPADLVGRIYYVGFTVSTLGTGDIRPVSEMAQIMTPIAAFSGLIMVTLAITYIVSLVSATVQKRQLSFSISGLGTTPEELLRRTWNGRDFRGLELPLNTLAAQLTQTAEQHRAYPILDNFHSRKPGGALVLQAAVLDEALSLLMHGVDKSQQPDPAILVLVRSSLSHYLDRITDGLGTIDAAVPETLSLNELAGLGPNLQDLGDYRAAMDALADRRRRLHQTVHNDGWKWSDVIGHAND